MMKVWTALLVCGAMVSVVAWAVALCHEKGFRPFAGATRFVRGLPWGGRLALLPLFAALVVYGSVKNSGGVESGGAGEGASRLDLDSGTCKTRETCRTNECLNLAGGAVEDPAMLNSANYSNLSSYASHASHTSYEREAFSILLTHNSQLTQADCEASFVLSGVGYGEEFDFAPPENAVVCEDWLRFGAHEDWIYIGPGAWSSRFGSNFVEKVRVFSCGGIDFFPEGHISLLNNPISIAPAANWHLLTAPGSLFWHAGTPSNTLLLAWQNALLNRQSNSLVNIQAELFPSGRMRITHNLSGETVAETEYVPAPQLPAHVSLDEVKGRFADGNTNAYYYADVAVEKGPSIVTVRCDAETALGDYAVAAYPGETNRLPFLIGPQYEVESEAAFAYFGVADCEVLETNFTDRIVGLQWPVEISFEEGYAESGKMFEMSVVPDFLGGNVWIGSSRGHSRAVGCACGCDVDTNGVVRISEDCSCNPCTIRGRYGYEGYGEEFEFNYYPEEDGEEEPADPEEPVEPPEEPKPSVSVWFDKSAVIFEDEYENSPGQFVACRSTRVKLTCCAYGGEKGVNFTVDLSGMGALKLVSGTPPSSRTIAPYETVTFEAEYEAEKASSQKDGTVARVKITENETNVIYDAEDKMTVVEVRISPAVAAPENSVPYRHKVGVYEAVECRQEPGLPKVQWSAESGDFLNSEEGSVRTYRCPLDSANNPLSAKIGEVVYVFNITVVEPQGIEARNVKHNRYGYHPNVSGYTGMTLNLYVKPLDVSYEALAVMEIPCNDGVKSGHFALPYFSNIWSHTSDNGAGNWVNIRGGNFFAEDEAALDCEVPQAYYEGTGSLSEATWRAGYIKWEIPLGWNIGGTSGDDSFHKRFSTSASMEIFLSENGTVGVKKLDNFVERMTNDFIKLNGKAVNDNP